MHQEDYMAKENIALLCLHLNRKEQQIVTAQQENLEPHGVGLPFLGSCSGILNAYNPAHRPVHRPVHRLLQLMQEKLLLDAF